MTSAVGRMIKTKPVVMFGKKYCPYAKRANDLLTFLAVDFNVFYLEDLDDESNIKRVLNTISKSYTTPVIFIKGKCVGGADDLIDLHSSGQLYALLQKAKAFKNL